MIDLKDRPVKRSSMRSGAFHLARFAQVSNT
ncbi:hypothetical protein FHX57_000099 [Paraburkholderia tropica]|nr:hypothetical protein [Paraburkholderia tropica]MBB6316808.1 hypothetical protein [Paraburkholderia tropica]